MAEKEPDVSWALKLFTTEPEFDNNVLTGRLGLIIGGVAGFCSALFVNYGTRKPIWSGLYKHISYTAIGAGVGFFGENKRNETIAERDAVYRHYITLHPEEFPEPEQKKWADVLQRWIPVR